MSGEVNHIIILILYGPLASLEVAVSPPYPLAHMCRELRKLANSRVIFTSHCIYIKKFIRKIYDAEVTIFVVIM